MKSIIGRRFKGLLPVVVDVETAGLRSDANALLEIAAVFLTGSYVLTSRLVIMLSHFLAP
jgi:ribonuclease T